jgi:hypothetical protein
MQLLVEAEVKPSNEHLIFTIDSSNHDFIEDSFWPEINIQKVVDAFERIIPLNIEIQDWEKSTDDVTAEEWMWILISIWMSDYIEKAGKIIKNSDTIYIRGLTQIWGVG